MNLPSTQNFEICHAPWNAGSIGMEYYLAAKANVIGSKVMIYNLASAKTPDLLVAPMNEAQAYFDRSVQALRSA